MKVDYYMSAIKKMWGYNRWRRWRKSPQDFILKLRPEGEGISYAKSQRKCIPDTENSKFRHRP